MAATIRTSTSPLLALLAAAATILAVLSPASARTLPEGLPDIKPLLSNPWSAFKNLSGCQFGDQRQGLARMKDYLCRFGYLPTPPAKFDDMFDADMERAIRTYQHNFGLGETGQLDAATVAKMMSPRCGVADIINGTSAMGRTAVVRGRNLYTYFPGSPSWPRSKTSLTYAITASTETTIDRATLSAVFASAFARWSAATTLNFTEAEPSSASEADITIGFHSGDHGDGESFDGPLGTLAHAFSPTDGRLHLDAAEAWVAGGDVSRASLDAAVDLESVAVHEIGHLLGLGHSSVEEAIMYPTITSRTQKVELAKDDVDGIQSLYGGNPNFKGVTPPATSSEETHSGAGRALSGPWSGLAGVAVAVGLALALLC